MVNLREMKNANDISRRELLKLAAAGAAFVPLVIQAENTGNDDRLDASAFLTPPAEYRGVTLWFWNDKLEMNEALRQLAGFRDAGWGAVITRAFMGLRTPYLSEEWHVLTERVIETSRQLGTRVWLQHADKNAGDYMVAGVPGMEERFRHKILVRAPGSHPALPNSRCLAESDGYGYHEWKVLPPGDWSRLMAVLDLMDEETVHAYLEKAYDPLAARYGRDFGKTIEAIWVDEPRLRIASEYTTLPAMPWTTRLPEVFQREWNYSILEHLPSLFVETGDYRKIRHHFWRTVIAQFKKAYWKPVSDWCARHAVSFAGHPIVAYSFNYQTVGTGAAMQCLEDMQTPGLDFLTKNLETWPQGRKYILAPKQASSVAHQLGRERVLAEMYGLSDEGLTFEDRKWVAEWFAALGVTYRCYHASLYTLRGRRKRFYPPHLSYQQPWWPENRRIADPMARLSYMLRAGQYAADILVLHTLESGHCEFSPLRWRDARSAVEDSLLAVTDNLLALHRSFDYGDEQLMSKYGAVEGSQLRIGKMRYSCVVMPTAITLRASTVKVLASFLDAGGQVISVGDLPERIDGATDPRVRKLTGRFARVENRLAPLDVALRAGLPPRFELTGKGVERVWVHERRAGSKWILFMANSSREQVVDAELRIHAEGGLERWNTETGKPETVPQWREGKLLATALRFHPGASHLLVLDESQKPSFSAGRRRESVRVVSLAPPFTVERRDPNALTLDFSRYRCGNTGWTESMPVIGVLEALTSRTYRGPLELQFQFRAARAPSAASLVIEDSDQYRVTLNGTEVRRAGDAYFRDRHFHAIDVSGRVREGENTVSIQRDFIAGDPKAIRDLERLYGTEIESIYVIGDFAVTEQKRGEFLLAKEDETTGGDLVRGGYPFFAGKLSLLADVELSPTEPDEQVFLELSKLQAVLALIRVNGSDAGGILWAPYRVDITRHIRAGSNRIEIVLVSSLRNLLGPHHYTGTEPRVSDRSFSGVGERADWMYAPQRAALKTWSDNYQFVPFGLVDGARILYEKATTGAR